jgi:glycosyltransferase involved in cell wall biosynthesis
MKNYVVNITVFTPTYNRICLLERLYKSLIAQTTKNFEWIIVDDGSSDTTEQEVNQWINERKILIKYLKQPNGGKHRAINKGIILAKGTLFFIVDSDDFLLPESLSIILHKYNFAKNKYKVSGVVGRRQYDNGKIVGNENFTELVSNSLDIRYKHSVIGDLVEIYELEKIKEFLFPEFDNETFCPEALIWNRLAEKNNLFFFNQGVYVTEYLEGGLTANITKIRMQSPNGSMLHYAELEQYTIPRIQKIKANINFWRFSFNASFARGSNSGKVSLINSIIGFPLGFIMYLKDLKKV